ncbi:hypothetical protein BOTBODRAFT_105664 [Botryobasidium botryosum FD-172 SS1]|uniref:Peptidase S54 rhomboid domain-containing protein n=1 Tax=Botryobasidium botryosum (strain FD-172 SS1) TaxID=930990 RepID=A0A067MPU2_BOTB1|nr:hypothetical protein BOTBODRAFT_105664 [Botryobasidium botryosum FD-172 SS1]
MRNTYFRDPRARSLPPPHRRGTGPLSQWRRKLDNVPSSIIFWSILGINGVVFFGWWFAVESYKKFGDHKLLVWMNENFTASLRNVASGRIWTVLTACFSHEGTGHILLNAMSFYFMAPPVLAILGNTAFLALYLGGGIVSSLTSLAFNNLINRKHVSSHGASGDIYSVVSFFACAFPRTTFLLFFIVPVPAWACVSGLFAWDLMNALSSKRGTTDSAGHIGGILAGIGYFLLRRRF